MTKEIHLINRPKGVPSLDDFLFTETSLPELKHDEILIKTLFLSVDPYMRGRMQDTKSYIPPFKLNEVIVGGGVGQVTESKSENYNVGDFVTGNLNWAEYTITTSKNIRKIDSKVAPISTHLGILGMPGLTAYFGLLNIGKPIPGETVVVSGAAGAVGSAVGQIAKIKGTTVVGIAGSDEKIDYLINDLGFDKAINYKSKTFTDDLAKALPNGVDIYYDNVGGEVTDEVIKHLNNHARIPLCGAISSYNKIVDIGPRMQSTLIKTSSMIQGFTVGNYTKDFHIAAADLGKWLNEGKLTYNETITEGIENVPSAFLGLFNGVNIGKQLVKVSNPK